MLPSENVVIVMVRLVEGRAGSGMCLQAKEHNSQDFPTRFGATACNQSIDAPHIDFRGERDRPVKLT